MVNQYESDDLRTKDEMLNPYSGVNELLKEGIESSNSVGLDFKGAAFNYVKDLLDKVAEKGWNAMPDLDIKIGYSKENGFFNFGTTYEV